MCTSRAWVAAEARIAAARWVDRKAINFPLRAGGYNLLWHDITAPGAGNWRGDGRVLLVSGPGVSRYEGALQRGNLAICICRTAVVWYGVVGVHSITRKGLCALIKHFVVVPETLDGWQMEHSCQKLLTGHLSLRSFWNSDRILPKLGQEKNRWNRLGFLPKSKKKFFTFRIGFSSKSGQNFLRNPDRFPFEIQIGFPSNSGINSLWHLDRISFEITTGFS